MSAKMRQSRAYAPLTEVELILDPSWPASRTASAILEAFRRLYGSALDIAGIQSSMHEIWTDLHDEFTKEELLRIGDVTHISVPMNDLNASITMPPSCQGHFIVFDAMLDIRLSEIFTAPRNEVAWAACYVRAAWGNTFDLPCWVDPAVERLTSIDEGPFPDSYSLAAARDFVYAHECGHFFLDHLSHGLHSKRNFGNQELTVFDPVLHEEIDADKFARDLLCRNKRRHLIMQQMGVDWLFGFLGAVLDLRQRADALRRGRPEPPIVEDVIAKRRTEAWEDYKRRIAESPNQLERLPENVVNVQRVRETVNNFNEKLAPALALIYTRCPAELMDWQARVIQSPMSDNDIQKYHDELIELTRKALHQLPLMSWRLRLWQWVKRAFIRTM
jgi:hypothetical protein